VTPNDGQSQTSTPSDPDPGQASHPEVHHPLFARWYARLTPRMEQVGYGERRGQLLAGLTGRVVEVGAGNGMNFSHYPTTVTRVLAVEPEAHLRQLAARNAEDAPVPIEVVDGTADRLPAGDGSYDAAVVSLVLCSVPDQHTALAEIHRVLRPGGELRFFEHVRATTPGLARLQRVMDATIWPLVAGGCHASRPTRTAIESAGFTVTRIEQIQVPDTRLPVHTKPHILGTATRQG
jgi:ubiquinone/menaquinone biosynthesis C-methylase UbiE